MIPEFGLGSDLGLDWGCFAVSIGVITKIATTAWIVPKERRNPGLRRGRLLLLLQARRRQIASPNPTDCKSMSPSAANRRRARRIAPTARRLLSSPPHLMGIHRHLLVGTAGTVPGCVGSAHIVIGAPIP